MLLPVSIVEWNIKVDNFNRKSQLQQYSALNVAGVYNLTLIMSTAGAMAGYPETGFEMIYFAIPSDFKKKEVTINSDYAMESKKIRKFIKAHIKSKKMSSSYFLNWTRAEHSTDSSRAALSLNGASKLYVKTIKNKDGSLHYDCHIKTNFHMNDVGTSMKIGKYTILRIEEGVFSGMQKINAFTPYVINWTWKIKNINDLENYRDILWIDDLIETSMTAAKK